MATLTPESLAKSGSEFGEQSALFCWANLAETRRQFPQMFRTSDGRCKLYSTHQNFMDVVKGARAKQIGIQSGVADIFLPVPRNGCAGLYIELKIDPQHPENLKRKKSNKDSPEQLKFGNQAIADGYGWAVAMGWQSAKALISQYLSS